MNQQYHDAVTTMQRLGVDRDYQLGWIGGYLGNPMLEEQRLTDAYEAGYSDGERRDTGNFETWTADKAC